MPTPARPSVPTTPATAIPHCPAANRRTRLLLLFLLLSAQWLLGWPARAQGCIPISGFVLQGEATRLNNCYRLTTQGTLNSVGTMWNPQPISLRSDFDLSFDINQCGAADGVVFVLQNVGSTPRTGNVGGSLSYYGGSGTFAQSVGIELDFFQNIGAPFNDPAQPHMMLALNGDPAAVRGPVPVPIGGCATHTLRVSWSAATRLLTVRFDGVTAFSYASDLVNTVFGGNPGVWFGIVGTTGGSTATQTVCPGLMTADVAPPVIAVAGPSLLCPGDQTALTVRNLPAGTTFAWSPAAGLSATTGAAVSAAPATSTTYYVTATFPGGCQSRDSVRIAVRPRPAVAVSPRQVVCFGGSARLTATSPEVGITQTWAPATGLSTTTGPAVVATPAATTRYTVSTTGPAFCLRQDTVLVVVRPPLQLAVSAVLPTAPGGRTLLTATSPVAGVAYAWSPATGLSATTGPTVTAAPPTTTTYTVTATAPAGCPEQATVVAQPFLLPNVITPNGDHRNDTFQALVSREPVTLQVFSRWGRLVFEQANYLDGWGADAPAGTYYYRLSTAAGQSWQGWVEVVR